MTKENQSFQSLNSFATNKIFEGGVTAPLTVKEKRLFQFIKIFVIKYYCQPTKREAAAFLGITETMVRNMLYRMEKKGWVKKYANNGYILRDE